MTFPTLVRPDPVGSDMPHEVQTPTPDDRPTESIGDSRGSRFPSTFDVSTERDGNGAAATLIRSNRSKHVGSILVIEQNEIWYAHDSHSGE